jgi:hypothetical protein
MSYFRITEFIQKAPNISIDWLPPDLLSRLKISTDTNDVNPFVHGAAI